MTIDPKTVGEPVRQTSVAADSKRLTVSTVLLDAISSSYVTTIYDDSEDKRHHGMHLGDEWIIGWGQQMGTRAAALDLHEDAVQAARTYVPVRA